MKNKVLIFIPFYLPGNKGGGPTVTISNMVEALGNGIFFRIATMDRDLGDTEPYENIKRDQWLKLNKTDIIYLSPEKIDVVNIIKLINSSDCDIIYLNSFFSYKWSIRVILLKALGIIKQPIVLAPRGEFSVGALALKKRKKFFFLFLAKLMIPYKKITWQASSEYEKKDIKVHFKTSKVVVASNLTALSAGKPNLKGHGEPIIKLVFISRISEKKNLALALRILKDSDISYDIIYDIYGPIEDRNYWKKCLQLIEKMPSNIKVNYQGVVGHDSVFSVLSSYDAFLFLTKGENFGHVIFESLYAGTPVILSYNTPWLNLKKKGIGWNVDYGNRKEVVATINELKTMTLVSYERIRKNAHLYAKEFSGKEEVISANIALFSNAPITTEEKN